MNYIPNKFNKVYDSIEIMHITVIEHTISQIYCVYKDMKLYL